MISFRVYGEPVGQGSMRHVGGGRLIASNDRALRLWRKAVASAAVEASQLAGFGSFTGAVQVRATFFVSRKPMDRKQGYEFPVRPYDVDKLARALNDAMSVDCDLIVNDSQVTDLLVFKRFASDVDAPGVEVVVTEL